MTKLTPYQKKVLHNYGKEILKKKINNEDIYTLEYAFMAMCEILIVDYSWCYINGKAVLTVTDFETGNEIFNISL